MAFSAFNTTEISSGKANKSDLWTKVKDDFDDHESRITALASTGLTTDPIQFSMIGLQEYIGTGTGKGYLRIPFAILVTSAKIFVPAAGSSGTLQIDVQKSAAGGGSFATIFSTQPSVTQASGNYSVSSNAVLSTTSFVAGDIFRYDVTSYQTGCIEAHLYITYTVA